MNCADYLKLYLVTDRGCCGNRDLVEVVKEAVKGGVTMVQLREKEISTAEFIRLALRLKQALKDTDTPIIINDRVDVALAVDADGVHLGQSDIPYEMARKILDKDKIIGLSVESMQDVEVANALDVDYIGVSPVFSTPTKTDTASPFGLDGLKKAVEMSVHPTVAIGGMNLSTLPDVVRTGVNGVAVVSAIVGAEDPCEASRKMRSILL